ncbi:hypothetical protein [Streptosporangium sp. NPDC002721]
MRLWTAKPCPPEHLPEINEATFAADRARLVELMAARQRPEETLTP